MLKKTCPNPACKNMYVMSVHGWYGDEEGMRSNLAEKSETREWQLGHENGHVEKDDPAYPGRQHARILRLGAYRES